MSLVEKKEKISMELKAFDKNPFPVLAERRPMMVPHAGAYDWANLMREAGFFYIRMLYKHNGLPYPPDRSPDPEDPEHFFVYEMWIRSALITALETGQHATFQNAIRILEDREYFESILPFPMSDERIWDWLAGEGTAMVVEGWWQNTSERDRKIQIDYYKKTVGLIDMKDFLFFLRVSELENQVQYYQENKSD